MILNSQTYVPALRWRMGEYQALFRLDNAIKDRIVPFITIPGVEFDFEDGEFENILHKHVERFMKRYKLKWGKRPSWIGVDAEIAHSTMNNGRAIFPYVFEALRKFESPAVPLIPLNAAAIVSQSVATITRGECRGAAISLRLEDLMQPEPLRKVEALRSFLGVPLSYTDLIIDLGAPNFEPYDVFSEALIVALRKMGDLEKYRHLVLIGTAFPESFRNIAKGADEVPRHDWLFYRTLVAKLPSDMRRPNFGDYTITHPAFRARNMLMTKPAGKIVYTTSNVWSVRKGGSFQDDREQMHDHCADIVSTNIFKGAGYSKGDEYIAQCAAREAGPSTLTRWKEVGINHHITFVSDELATFGGAP